MSWIFIVGFLFISAAPQIQTYDQLLHAIREVRTVTQQRIEQAVEQEKVREAWETGKLIDEHILLHKERADYGKVILPKLAADLEVSESELYRMLKFARMYPSILAAPPELSWAHYRELMVVEDPQKREKITREAASQRWSQKRLRREIKKQNLIVSEDFITKPLQAKPGKPGVYRIVDWQGKKVYDLGFETFFEIKRNVPKQKNPPAEDLYTYEVKDIKVIDGDTIWAEIHLGFGVWTHQKLRLRGLDAPEIESAEGKESKAFLESVIARSVATKQSPILIKTVKSDKYDRYLVDLWAGNQYLNQKLLDEDLAVRVNE